ncbi:MAG: ATP-binding cassette domain-containing protein, partial [Chloroflexota bacterium]|nr:ATP-binding cassette domain-containing protein [Chloroflexota bacterium]
MRVCHRDRVVLEVPALEIGEGETLSLIGPNGAGKSTLLQLAALLRRPDAGEVLLRGERATRSSTARLRRRVAVVFQDPLLFDVGVLANVAAGLRFRGVARPEAEQTAAAWLTRFGVRHLADRNARALSGGEAQRVSLARAFAT